MAKYVHLQPVRCRTLGSFVLLSFFSLLSFNALFAQISIDFDVNAPKCFSYTDGSVVANVSGGQTPYSFEWSTGSTAMGLYGIGAGTYSVTVTDANNEQASASVTVEDPTAVAATIAFLNDVCNQPARVGVTASGGAGDYTYEWSTGSTSATVAGLSPGQYCVTVSDGNWCIDVACVIVPTPLELALSSLPPVCPLGCDGSAAAVVTGGKAPYTYLWSNGATTSVNPNLLPGVFSVTVTDANGCTVSGNVTVEDGVSSLTADITFDNPDCEGTGAATVSASGGEPPYEYVWNTGQTGESLTDLSSGIYTVTVTDVNGCTAVVSAELIGESDLDVAAELIDYECGDETGSITVIALAGFPPYTYEWSNGQTGPLATGLTPGTVYQVTVTDITGCTVEAGFPVVDPDGLDFELNVTQPACAGFNDGEAAVVPPGDPADFNYTWSNGVMEQTASFLGPGEYSVTVYDNMGCGGIQSFTIEAPEELAVEVITTPDDCGEGAGTATAMVSGGTPPYMIKWSTGQMGETIDGLLAGTYTVVVTDANECEIMSLATVEGSEGVDCSISGDQLVCPREIATYTLDLDGECDNPEISWSLSQGSDATIISQDGLSVTVMVDNDCEGWFVLIATISCEGCPDVVCEYPVDVVLTDFTINVPEDVTLDACISADEVEAAFADFLDAFSFSIFDGGCGAEGNFEEDYSAPAACGGSVTVVYTVSDECGRSESRSATFTVPECMSSCDISGDQLVCPREIATYTLNLDGGCADPQVSWSLYQDSDATIISQEGTSVTVMVDNDCEGWFTLIATVSCEGCDEDIVCEYPVDVVLTDITINVPEDVTVDACISAEEIEAAFADFLDAFSFSIFDGGCGTEGNFDEDYSAPAACGGSVTVSYTVSDECGRSESRSATFTVPECLSSCDISGDQLVCPREVATYTLNLDGGCADPQVSWSLYQDSDATIISQDGNSVTVMVDNDCEGWFTLIATVECEGCDETIVCEYPVDVVLTDITINVPEDVTVDACVSAEEIEAAFADFLDAFSFSIFDGGCGTEGNFDEEYSAPDQCGGSVTVTYTVSDECGRSESRSATFTVPECTTGECVICINFDDPGEIAYTGGPLCGPGNDPPPIVNVKLPSGGQGEIEFLWMKSTKSGSFRVDLFEPIPNSNSQSYDPGPLQETTYFARCARRVGCPSFVETTVVKIEVGDDAVARITAPETICTGEPVVFMAEDNGTGASYSWDFGVSSSPRTSTEQNPVVTYDNFGIRTVRLVVENNGCTSTEEIRISIINNGPDCSPSAQVAFYPNPFRQLLNVEMMEGDPNLPMQISIETLYGQRVKALEWSAGLQKHEIITSDLAAGVYVARVKVAGGQERVYMIVKQEQ